MEQSRERSSAPPHNLGAEAVEKEAFWSPSTTIANFTFRATPYSTELKPQH